LLHFVVRFADGFGYYGVILTTTELMQMNDICYGMSLSVCLSVSLSLSVCLLIISFSPLVGQRG